MMKKNSEVLLRGKQMDMSDIEADPVLRFYNKNIVPRENRFVATCTFGEGWHNYHHVFPFDYKAAEHFDTFNLCTTFINIFKRIGWAYDLREATPEMINGIAKRLGDGTPVHFPMPIQSEN
ncbi:unnamed protein product [Parnassius apollo]|uniref:(apollo) hypothetical protein n=1 Tax=Parnassius apollo TaxID=110799 RepID=A0A8S3W6V2_PARAO|nr:unnamed protein product [Parnassius apollo]